MEPGLPTRSPGPVLPPESLFLLTRKAGPSGESEFYLSPPHLSCLGAQVGAQVVPPVSGRLSKHLATRASSDSSAKPFLGSERVLPPLANCEMSRKSPCWVQGGVNATRGERERGRWIDR